MVERKIRNSELLACFHRKNASYVHRSRDLCHPKWLWVFVNFGLYKQNVQSLLGGYSIPRRIMFRLSSSYYSRVWSWVFRIMIVWKYQRTWREVFRPSRWACTAGLGERVWPGGLSQHSTPHSSSTWVTANAERGTACKPTVVSLWDILLLISDVCLPLTWRIVFPSCVNLIFPICLVIFQNVM